MESEYGRKMKKYRVNESENFNLHSMYDHLKVMEIECIEGERAWEEMDGIIDRLEEVERLLDKAPCIGSLVDWPTLERIREIRDERNLIRYNIAKKSGANERDAGYAFM